VSPVDVSYKSLNQGDVFVLDCGLKLFQWNGKTSSKAERAKVRPAQHNAAQCGQGDSQVLTM
jgi:hypothetical protein